MLSRRCLNRLCLVLLVVTAACGETTPTAPSVVVNVEGPGFLTPLTCPATIDRVINGTGEVLVSFSLPTAGGQEATKSSCSPASGSMFRIGTTTVTCSATEAPDLVSSCTFMVRVTSRSLAATRFVAFGDSITSGIVSTALATPTLAGNPISYPAQLQDSLVERYPDQDFTVINAGVGGEDSAQGRARLPGVLDAFRPEVLLLLEGINRLELTGAARVASNLDAMVAAGRSRGAIVLLATLTPVGNIKEIQRPGVRAAIVDLNRRIWQIARDRRLGSVVDLFAVFERNPSLIGRDGLHPTVAGYRVMADEFLGAIVSRLEQNEGPAVSLSLQAVPTAVDALR